MGKFNHMKTYTNIPERADFSYQQLVGPHKVTGKSMHDLRGFFGLHLTKTMPFGCFRTQSGEIFAVVRALNAPGATHNPTTFIFQSTLIDGKNLRIDNAHIAPQAKTAVPVMDLKDDVAHWASQPGDEGNRWHISASGDVMSWTEEGLFNISGKLIGTGMQWFLPGRDWGTYYVSQLYDVAGECLGEKVKGMIALDQAYMAEGGAIHQVKDLVVNNKMHVVWWSFATVYKDGTFDSGSIMIGHDNLGYAILTDQSGIVRTTTNIEAVVKHKEGSYFIEEIKVMIDGTEEWEFLPDPKGEMIDFLGGFPVTAQQEGRWRRVGDTRKPDHWFGWGETDRRNGTARNIFGSDLKKQD